MDLNFKLENSLKKKYSSRLALIFSLKRELNKTAEVIEIDGKFYEEDADGNVVEVSNDLSNMEILEPRSYVVEGYDFTFTEGEDYANWFGVYRVLDINEDARTMDVQYIEVFRSDVKVGEVKTYPMAAQAQTITKAQKSKEIQMRLDNMMDLKGTEAAFTMGFIAANGYLSAEIGPKYHVSFPAKYKTVTGEDPNKYLGHGYKKSDNDKRWSYTLRVQLPILPEELVSRLIMPSVIQRSKGVECNNGAFVWGLFAKGFSIGRNNHKIAQIASSLSDEDQRAFMAGADALNQLQNIEEIA